MAGRGTLMAGLLAVAALTAMVSSGYAATERGAAEEATPGYNNKIPESILTPDTVETMVGTLEFFDGIPNEKVLRLPLV